VLVRVRIAFAEGIIVFVGLRGFFSTGIGARDLHGAVRMPLDLQRTALTADLNRDCLLPVVLGLDVNVDIAIACQPNPGLAE